jgi:DNA-binding transcriptional ArsR family regulator
VDILGPTRSRVRSELLYRFFRAPEQGFYVRELERLAGTSAGNVRRELLRLTEAGLLARHGDGNTVRYGLNPDYPLLEETRAIVKRVLGVEYALCEALDAVDNGALAYAHRIPAGRGSEQIDVTVVGDPDAHALIAALKPVEQRVNARLTCSVYDPELHERRSKAAQSSVSPYPGGPSWVLLKRAKDAPVETAGAAEGP